MEGNALSHYGWSLAVQPDCLNMLKLKRPGSVWNCLLGHAPERSPGINCKSRVLYRGPGFLSSATWHLLLKKHYNGIINQSSSRSTCTNIYRARKSRTTLQNKVRLKVLPEQLTLFVNTSVTFKKCIIQ